MSFSLKVPGILVPANAIHFDRLAFALELISAIRQMLASPDLPVAPRAGMDTQAQWMAKHHG
jgi:hypothetical protein